MGERGGQGVKRFDSTVEMDHQGGTNGSEFSEIPTEIEIPNEIPNRCQVKIQQTKTLAKVLPCRDCFAR